MPRIIRKRGAPMPGDKDKENQDDTAAATMGQTAPDRKCPNCSHAYHRDDECLKKCSDGNLCYCRGTDEW
ncbi:hypothetical protein TSOC_000393 [Tetrabaena socialis]|uniref:Uncharacterized protein n=1 Tax=Tetrabaena socialis TaxID=47790 RepID=A0A2J8AJL0_9CHLO|nr:hypothetical protein TSOC_000393 [Tetrabaena socialis]|eukprot:PNH12712.1 hypothetical protein TSOC_000393 [Tetrabaena socialis]